MKPPWLLASTLRGGFLDDLGAVAFDRVLSAIFSRLPCSLDALNKDLRENLRTGQPMGDTFGARLRRLREERGFSVPELASAVGSSEGTIRQLESGQVKNPAFVLGLRLATKLTVDPYYLALGEGFDMLERFDLMDRRIAALESAANIKPRP